MQTRMLGLICGTLAAAALVTGCGGGGSSARLAQGLELYRQNDLENALSMFVLSSMDKPKDPAARAWTAETLRRLDRRNDAYNAARDALALDPCQAFAFVVLGDVFNPQFGSWEGKADDEVAWRHYLQSVACNRDDGNGWLSIWTGAVRRGETALAATALQRLGETRFFTQPMLAYNRWMLNDLPPDAVLFVNGDMDTYPALVLQETEGFRTDVAVINLSLLNTEWYARNMALRHGLPLPSTPFLTHQDDQGQVQLAGKQWVGFWIERRLAGEIARPLAAAVTVPELDFTPSSRENALYSGAYFELGLPAGQGSFDINRVRAAMRAVTVKDFVGPFASEQDRSAVRQAFSSRLADNIPATGLRHATAMLGLDLHSEAMESVEWAASFVAKVPCDPGLQDSIQEVKARVREKMP